MILSEWFNEKILLTYEQSSSTKQLTAPTVMSSVVVFASYRHLSRIRAQAEDVVGLGWHEHPSICSKESHNCILQILLRAISSMEEARAQELSREGVGERNLSFPSNSSLLLSSTSTWSNARVFAKVARRLHCRSRIEALLHVLLGRPVHVAADLDVACKR